ncbi:MAG: hypothetical protein ACFFCW_33150 [Candidatus Hodarchaeota archaeon]
MEDEERTDEDTATDDKGQDQDQGQDSREQNFEALRGEVQELKNQNQLLQDQLELYRANVSMGQTQERRTETQAKDDAFGGMEDEDVLTVADAKKIFGAKEAQFSEGLSEMRMAVLFPDYRNIVTQHLPNVLKNNPTLATALKDPVKYRHLIAYELAKTDPEFTKTTTGSQEEKGGESEADRIIKNAQKTKSVSQAGGGGGGLSKLEMYATMSDEDFEKEIAKVKAREI